MDDGAYYTADHIVVMPGNKAKECPGYLITRQIMTLIIHGFEFCIALYKNFRA